MLQNTYFDFLKDCNDKRPTTYCSNRTNITAFATSDDVGSSVILVDYTIKNGKITHNVKIHNPNFWLVLLGEGLSFKDRIVCLQLNIKDAAEYCAIKLILAALLYGKISLKYLLRNFNKKFLYDLAHSNLEHFLSFFEQNKYYSYEINFACDEYNIQPTIIPVNNIPFNPIITTILAPIQSVIANNKHVEIMIENGQLINSIIGFDYTLTNGHINIIHAGYHPNNSSCPSEWSVDDLLVQIITVCDATFTISTNNEPIVNFKYGIPSLSLYIHVVVTLLPDGNVKVDVSPDKLPIYSQILVLNSGSNSDYVVSWNLQSTNDGVNIYAIDYKIKDIYQYNNFKQDRLASNDGTIIVESQLNILYPNFALVLNGEGITFEQKIKSLGVNRGLILQYTATKIIVARMLYGFFDIKFLLSSFNKDFLEKLSSEPRLSFLYDWFVEHNSMNTHFKPCINLGNGVGKI